MKKVIACEITLKSISEQCDWVSSASFRLRQQLPELLKNPPSDITVKKFDKGNMGAYLLTFNSLGERQVVLKKMQVSKLFSELDLLKRIKTLNASGLSVCLYDSFLDRNQDTWVLWEYAEPSRETQLSDLIEVTKRRVADADNHPVDIDPNLQYSHSFLYLLTHYSYAIFNEHALDVIPNPEMLASYRAWATRILSPDFLARYHKLPKSVTHCDIKPDNIVVTKKGPKLIDWDDARVDTRLFELSRFVSSHAIRMERDGDNVLYVPDPDAFNKALGVAQAMMEELSFSLEEKALLPEIMILDRLLDDAWRIHLYLMQTYPELRASKQELCEGFESLIGRYPKERVQNTLENLWPSYRPFMEKGSDNR